MRASGVERRAYVSAATLTAIREMAAVRVAWPVFRFQPESECIRHTASMLHQVVDRLGREGQIKRKPPSLLQRAARALLVPRNEGLVSMGPAPDAKTLHLATRSTGPLQLVSHAGLQPGQGGAVYDRLHATVLLASLEHRGRHIGILLDGNDLQDSPVTRALQTWQARSGDTRALHQLSASDFEAFNRDHPDLDFYQCAFRLVDLDAMVQAGRARAASRSIHEPTFGERSPLDAIAFSDGNTVLAVPDVQPVGEPMTAAQARTLALTIENWRSDVERAPRG